MYRKVLLHATLLSRDLYKRVLDYKINQGTAFCFTAGGLSFSYIWAVSRLFEGVAANLHKLQSDNTRILKMLQSVDTRILKMIAEKLLLRVNHLQDSCDRAVGRLQDLELVYSVQMVMAVAGLSAYMYRRLRDIDGDGANAAPAG